MQEMHWKRKQTPLENTLLVLSVKWSWGYKVVKADYEIIGMF